MLDRIRRFPEGATAEDTLRKLAPEGVANYDFPPIRPCLNYIYEQIEREGDVGGVVGYSEGAMIAATLLFDQERRHLETGRPRRLKVGLFFNGWPAMDPDEKGVLLADETEEVVHLPSIHVIGSGDPYLQGAMSLYNLFDEDAAVLFDHAKGHTIPRDTRTIKELGDTIREAIHRGEQM
ncbi:MAG: hypothetical protein Q9227_004811 [Pyrenula ochraceoflavens]